MGTRPIYNRSLTMIIEKDGHQRERMVIPRQPLTVKALLVHAVKLAVENHDEVTLIRLNDNAKDHDYIVGIVVESGIINKFVSTTLMFTANDLNNAGFKFANHLVTGFTDKAVGR